MGDHVDAIAYAAKQLARQKESNARTFADLSTRVRAAMDVQVPAIHAAAREVARRYNEHLAGMRVVLSRVAESILLLENDRTVILPQHSAEAEAAMAAELVACTLGARSRPELLPRDPWSVDHAPLQPV